MGGRELEGVVTPEHSPLPALQVGGFGASVDAFAWEPDPGPAARRMRLWFLSLLGPQQALKAIWARLLRGEVATLSREALGQAIAWRRGRRIIPRVRTTNKSVLR
jgi:hypothetical protein